MSFPRDREYSVFEYAQYGSVGQLRKHLKWNPEEIDSIHMFKLKRTPLHFAVISGSVEKIELMIELGSRALDIPDQNGSFPIHYAVESKNRDTVSALIRLGSKSINAKDKHGRTPFGRAVNNQDIEMAKILIQLGSFAVGNPEEFINVLNSAPWSREAQIEYENIIHQFITLGCGPLDVKDKEENTIFHLGAMWGYSSIIEYAFYQEVPHLNAKNDRGQTPLFCAAEQGYDTTIETLYRLGCRDVDLLDENGYSPLSYAILGCHREIIILLRSLGANPEIVTRDSIASYPLLHLYVSPMRDPMDDELWTVLTAPIPESTILEIRSRVCFSRSLVHTLLFD